MKYKIGEIVSYCVIEDGTWTGRVTEINDGKYTVQSMNKKTTGTYNKDYWGAFRKIILFNDRGPLLDGASDNQSISERLFRELKRFKLDHIVQRADYPRFSGPIVVGCFSEKQIKKMNKFGLIEAWSYCRCDEWGKDDIGEQQIHIVDSVMTKKYIQKVFDKVLR